MDGIISVDTRQRVCNYIGGAASDGSTEDVIDVVNPATAEVIGAAGQGRPDRPYRIYPDPDPDHKYPIGIRSIAADQAYLSPFYQRDSISVSICGHKYLNYREFLAGVAATLDPFDPRPHWGKIHYMDQERLRAAFPEYGRFLAVRERLDPEGVFLGTHLGAAFG